MEHNKVETKHEPKFPANKEELVKIAARIIGCDTNAMDDFLCLYQWGSRLFGTNESSSDCDMIAVVRGYKFGQLKGKEDHAPYWHKVQDVHYMNVSEELIDGINYDVVVYEEKYWQYMLDQHMIWVLPFEFLGDESNPKVLRKKTQFKLTIRWQMLHYQANIDSSKNAKYAKKYWVKLKEYRRAKKRLVYILQHLTFAVQIVERGLIYDYTAGNHYHYDIMAQKFPSMQWEEVDDWFKPKMEAILKKLEEICFSFQKFTFTGPNLKPVQKLVEYLRHVGLDQSVKCLSIWPEPCNEKHPELIQLLPKRKETPWFVEWFRTCPSLVINKNTFEIVSYSLDNFSKDALELRKTLKLGPKIHINEKLDGVQVTLYWYHDQWHAVVFNSYDQFSLMRREKILECFWSEWHKRQYKYPEDTTKSYIFELIGPQEYLRQIVQYEDTQLVLIGVRDLKTLEECELEPFSGYGWKILPNLAEEDEFKYAIEKDSHFWYVIARLACDRKLLQRCGLVIRDGNFNRTQEINPGYEALQTLIRREYDPMFPDLIRGLMLTVVKAVQLDEVDRFKAAYPEWVEMFEQISEKFDSFCKKFDDYYKNFEHLITDKELGGKITKSPFKAIVFLMRRNNLTAREAFCSPMTLSNSLLSENCDKAVLHDQLLHYLSAK